jgi:CBS domain-containing protein
MTVKAILGSKGYSVETMSPQATLSEAAKRLSERGIGAVVVTGEAGQIDGMLSERDIVRALAARGAAALEQPVKDIMTQRVITCQESDTVALLMEQMTTGKFRHVPVVEGRRLVGIVSIGDIVKQRLEQIEGETNAMRDYILTA